MSFSTDTRPEEAAQNRLGAFLTRYRVEGLFLILTLALTVGLYAYAFNRYPDFIGDYDFHIRLALEMKDTTSLKAAHFLYHAFVILIDTVVPDLSIRTLIFISTLTWRAVFAAAIFVLARITWGRALSIRAGFGLTLVTLCCLVIGPITLATWEKGDLYLGYVPLNPLHNPTALVLEPFALLAAWMAARMLFPGPEQVVTPRETAFTALLIVLSALAKPNYVIALLPAAGVITADRLWRKQPVRLKQVIWGIAIPSVAVLIWQYAFTYMFEPYDYGVPTSDSTITLAPFEIMEAFARGSSLLVLFVSSIVFPTLVYAMYFKDAIRDRFFTLSFVVFLFGAFYTYFLAETGYRRGHGNFTWSGQIALLIWTIAALFFLVRQNRPYLFGRGPKMQARAVIAYSALALHVLSGLLWVALFGNNYWV